MARAPLGYDGVPTHAELNIGVDFFAVKAVEKFDRNGCHDGHIVTFFAPGPNAVIVKHSRAYSFGVFLKTPASVLQDYAGCL
jgi:hypothetical protein